MSNDPALKYENYSVSYAGSVTPVVSTKYKVENLTKFDGVYKISEAVLNRMKIAELAVYGKGRFMGLNQFMITLTFPITFNNFQRIEINMRFKDLARKTFPFGGMWFLELHTGEDYTNRKGVLVKGNVEMKGKYHFHYKVITTMSRGRVLSWLKRQQINDGVAKNSYHVGSDSSDLSIYAAAYAAKKKQKEYQLFGTRPWASWGVNKKSVKISGGDLLENFHVGLNENTMRLNALGNDYPVKVYKLKETKEKANRHGI